MSFISTNIVPIAAAGVGGDASYVAKYSGPSGVTGGGGQDSKVFAMTDLQDGTVGIWHMANLYNTSPTRDAAGYSRINVADGTLLISKAQNLNSQSNNTKAFYASDSGLQFVFGRFHDGSGTVDGIQVFDKDGTMNNPNHVFVHPSNNVFAVHPTSGRVFYGYAGDRLGGATYDTTSGWTKFYEAVWNQGGNFQSLVWHGSKLCGWLDYNSGVYSMKFSAASNATSLSLDLTRQEPNFNNFAQNTTAFLTMQDDATDLCMVSNRNNKYSIVRHGGSSFTPSDSFEMDRNVTINSYNSYIDCTGVMIDRAAQSNYVYSYGRIRWRPQWAEGSGDAKSRGSVFLIQHNFSDLSINKVLAITLITPHASADTGTNTGMGDNTNLSMHLLNDDSSIIMSLFKNKGTNLKGEQDLYVIKIPTDFTSFTLGDYNNLKIEDITSTINSVANPGVNSNATYVRNYSISSATPDAAVEDTVTQFATQSFTTNIVNI